MTINEFQPEPEPSRRIKRSEVASFLWQNNVRIRGIVRSKMGRSPRSLSDSDDVVASVVRRVAALVARQSREDLHEDEVWKIIATIAQHDVISKARLVQRARALIAEDGEYARVLEQRAAGCAHDEEAGDLVMELYMSLDDSIDRQMFLLRMRGASHRVAAELLGLSADATRQRWSTLSRRLLRKLRDLHD